MLAANFKGFRSGYVKKGVIAQGDVLLKQAAGERRGEKSEHTFCASELADNCDVAGIAAETADVALDPMKGGDLIE